MYITINDVIGEKTIDLSYPIYPEKEITVVSMFSNNSQILLQKSMEVLLYTGKKIVLNKGIYTDKELDLKSQMLDSRDDVLRTNKLKEITKVAISLNKLDNSDDLEDGRPSNTLFTYYVTSPEDFTRFEPRNPQYMKLKCGEIENKTENNRPK